MNVRGLIARLIVLIVAATLVVACGDEHEATTTRYRYDMVTYQGYRDGVALFQYWGRGDSASVTLKAVMPQPAGIVPGRRLLAYYSLAEEQDALPTRNVVVKGLNHAGVLSDSLRVPAKNKTAQSYKQHPLRLRSLWRTGPYINVRCELEYTKRPRMFMLMADPSTLASDTVECYLVHDLLTACDSTYFWRSCYGSFFVGNVWRRKSCHTLRVHVADVINAQVKCYDFDK